MGETRTSATEGQEGSSWVHVPTCHLGKDAANGRSREVANKTRRDRGWGSIQRWKKGGDLEGVLVAVRKTH